MGLARLLVLETLPKAESREDYVVQRRSERGRPPLNTWRRNQHKLHGNMKDNDPDDIAEWVYEDDVANYHTFTVPYGPKYNAKRIEKLLFIKDLLLNAEWNTKKDRNVNLHRHPCFIGDAELIIHDCCGTCPRPVTDEEHEAFEEESKIYVGGDLEFMKDDPGRQAIGSFNPLTEDDWTDMAYVGNTAELCQAICDRNLGFVQEWCTREASSLDRRDHTGRTPLQLAVQCSSPDIVQCLINNGARIVARVVDGYTALHMAAWHGRSEMVNALLEKSEANEEEEARKEDLPKASRKTDKQNGSDSQMPDAPDPEELKDDMEEDEDMDDASSDSSMAVTEGSFVKVKPEASQDEAVLDEATDEPDVYDVNVLGKYICSGTTRVTLTD
ncbi:hypothetical protein MMC13_007045 [Lambiella insularis]|nr:hypothetical protein [Lambiella insularis]